MFKRLRPRVLLAAAAVCLTALGGCTTTTGAGPIPRDQPHETALTFATAMARGVPAAAGVYGIRQGAADLDDRSSTAVSRADGEHGDAADPSMARISAQMGAGFFVSGDGLIATAAHVVSGATQIIVKLADQRVAVAELVGADADADIAVIRVPLSPPAPPVFGTSNALWPGDWVPAIGEPYGLDRSVRGRPYANGALINDVDPQGLAASMGVRKGDIVVWA